MITKAVAEKNRITWANIIQGALQNYTSIIDEGIPWISDNPQLLAYYCVDDGATLLIAGLVEKADRLFTFAEQIARTTLQDEHFDRGHPMRSVYDEPTAFARGKAMCLETIHHAHWYRTGEKNPALLREAVGWYVQYHDLWYGKKDALEEVMWRYILAEEYTEAINWYHERYRKALAAPVKDKRFLLNMLHALYFLAEFARGNNEIESIACAGAQLWHERSVDRSNMDIRLLHDGMRAWTYFWQYYFHSNTDIRDILIRTRGYE
ncbi:MAG: hypothetical protein ACYC7E_03195 [Armatimonadota bacterium]